MKIRLRLTLWFTLLVFLITCIGAILGWVEIQNQMNQLAHTELEDKQSEIQGFIESLASEFKQRGIVFDLESEVQNLSVIASNAHTSLYDHVFVQVSSNQGKILTRSPNLQTATLPRTSFNSPIEQTLLNLKGHQRPILLSDTSLMVGNKQIGRLQLAIDMEKSNFLLQRIFISELLSIVLAIVASLILGQFLAQRALKPMLEITGQVQQMAGQDLFRRLDTDKLNQDEIGVLAETFNGLLQRIESVFMAQQNFMTDASHEFRTPLTAIRGHAQLIQKRGAIEELRLKSAATIIRESRRLNRLVDHLLLLAKLESKSEEFTQINLVEILQEVYEDLEPLHPCLELELKETELIIAGHPDLIRRILLNLLDNAFKALQGHEDDQVKLICKRHQHIVSIRIEDTGSGIEVHHLPHIFERFYRIEADRSRETGGSGIGLALVYEMVRLHHGHIEVSSQIGKGTCFEIELPLYSPKAETGLLGKTRNLV